MTARSIWLAGALLGGLGVALGAFGAHGLKKIASAEMLQIWETAVRYHMDHAIALIGLGLFADRFPASGAGIAATLWLAGIAIFSGTLYAMTLTGARWLGAITPIGGVALIAGWVAFAVAIARVR
ncbi:MAG: DUF423 domain-containing protein [Deltaproteobacteria bacterium]|nr:DUF423 domain-containing protein [Deltaproteobacteria bacterium]